MLTVLFRNVHCLTSNFNFCQAPNMMIDQHPKLLSSRIHRALLSKKDASVLAPLHPYRLPMMGYINIWII